MTHAKVYGIIELIGTGASAALMIAGVVSTSPSVDWTGIAGHLAIWDPYWLVGGLLFVMISEPLPHQAKAQLVAWFRK